MLTAALQPERKDPYEFLKRSTLLPSPKPFSFAKAPVEKSLEGAFKLVPLSEAKQRFKGLSINERNTVNSALFRSKTLPDGTPAGNVQGDEGFFVPEGVLRTVESAVLEKRLKALESGTRRFVEGREAGRSAKVAGEALAKTIPTGRIATTDERIAGMDPLNFGQGSLEQQAEAVSPRTFPLERRGGKPIATFEELRRDLGDELYSQGFQKIATLGGRLDPTTDPVAWLSGMVLTGSLVTPLEIERTNAFIAQRDAQVARGEAPPIAQDLKDRVGAAANYTAVASSIFGPAGPATKVALAKSVLKHSYEPTLPAFKAKVLKDALESNDRGFKEAALRLAKTEAPVSPQTEAARLPGTLAKGAVEQSAKEQGVGLSFRAPKKVEPEAPSYSFRPKSEVQGQGAVYSTGQKYHQPIPEVTHIDPKRLKNIRPETEVSRVSPEVAAKMDFSEPVEASVFADGTVGITDGHHRAAAAKQQGLERIPVTLRAINAKGEAINELIEAGAPKVTQKPAEVSRLSSLLKAKSTDLGAKAEQIKAEMKALESQFGGSVGAAGGGFDPKRLQWLSKAADYGAVKVAEGATEFASWSVRMVEDLGDAVKPHLDGIWRSLASKDPDKAFSEYADTQRVSPVTKESVPLFGRPKPSEAATTKPRRLFQETPAPAQANRQGTPEPAPSASGAGSRPRLFQDTPSTDRPTVGKADVGRTRAARGLSEITDEPPEKVGDWLKEADSKGYDRAWVNRTAEQIGEKPRSLSDSETAAFLKHRQDLLDEFDRLKKVEDPTEGELGDILQIEREFDRVDGALRTSGREWGRAGVARQLSINEQFDELTLKARARAAKGAPLTAKESQRIKELSDELSKVTKERDELLTVQATKDAESLVQAAARSRPRAVARAKIQKEIEDIFKELEGSGMVRGGSGGIRQGRTRGAVSPITAADLKVAADRARLVKRLANAYIRLGANELADVVAKVQTAFLERFGVEIEGQAVIDAIGRTERRTRTETEAALRAVQSQAKKRTTEAQAARNLDEALAKINAERKALDEATDKDLGAGWRESEEAFRAKLKASKKSEAEVERQLKAAEKAKAKSYELAVAKARAKKSAEQAEKVEKMIADAEKRQREWLQSGFEQGERSKRAEARREYVKWWREHETPADVTDKVAKETWKQWWRAQAAIIDLENQLVTGDFKLPVRKTTASKELDDLLARRKLLQGKVQSEIGALKPRTGLEKAVEAVNSARTLQSVGDFSVLFRQTLSTLARHPVKTTKAFKEAVKGTFSQGVAARLDDNLRNADPAAQLLRDRGKLHMPELGSSGARAEEAMAGRLVKRLPLWKSVIDASERNMVLTLNHVRASVYDDWVKVAEDLHGGRLPDEELKKLGSAVNALTGRGSLGSKDAAFDALSTVFFAPRFAWSRFQTLGNAARFGGTAANKVVGKKTREAIVAQVLATVGVMELAEANGAEVNWTDPSKSDWLQIRLGDRLIDPWGGYRQVFRVPGRLVSDVSKQARGEKKSERGFEDLAFEFAQYKAGPLLRLPTGVVQGRDFLGRQIEPGFDAPFVGEPGKPDASAVGRFGRPAELAEPRIKALAEFFTPLSWPEAADALEKKDAQGLALAPLILLGIGVREDQPKSTGLKGLSGLKGLTGL